MKHKRLFPVLFVLVALAQLFLPYKLIRTQAEETLKGNTFNFRIRHIRPDAFERGNTRSSIQGKYVWLQFEQNRFKPSDMEEWRSNRPVYVTFEKDSLGFAKIRSVLRSKPHDTGNYVKARAWTDTRDSTALILMYPFRNYYLADKNTEDIDLELTKKLKDTLTTNYLVVKIRDNQYLASDLVIDSLSFRDFVKKIREPR